MYTSVDVEQCREARHKLITAWSDKTPMKVNIICETCSNSRHTAYAAYGVDTKSWGAWRRRKRETHETEEDI